MGSSTNSAEDAEETKGALQLGPDVLESLQTFLLRKGKIHMDGYHEVHDDAKRKHFEEFSKRPSFKEVKVYGKEIFDKCPDEVGSECRGQACVEKLCVEPSLLALETNRNAQFNLISSTILKESGRNSLGDCSMKL
ncbi:hypothetical protein Tco_0320744 [Tanacetum coccineum]